MIIMKIQLKLMSKAAILALLAFVAVEQTSQAQISITMSVNGYFGSNLSSTGANLADGTIVKLGMFYNNSAFTPTADISASWAALSGSMESRLSRLLSTVFYRSITALICIQILLSENLKSLPKKKKF